MSADFVKFDRENLIINVSFDYKKNLIITRDNVQISYFSGGPGGQNINKNMNGIRLIYRIPDDYRINSLKTQQITTKSINERKREQNLIRAFEQLAQKIYRYFYVKPDRKKTKIPKKSKEKRLKNKKSQSSKKESRKNVQGDL